MAATQYVYKVVHRRDYEHHEDEEGRLALVGLHATVASANAAAKAHLSEESENALDDEPEVNEEYSAYGRFTGTCYSREDERDHFTVEMERMELEDGDGDNASDDGDEDEDEDEDDNEDEDDEPAAKRKRT